jgi:hypothetical protein
MIRWLLIALFIYILYKLIRGKGPGNNNRNRDSIFGKNRTRWGRRNKNLDHIEEAEFEDITPKEKSN